MKAQEFAARVNKLYGFLLDGRLCPAHQAVAQHWYERLTGAAEDGTVRDGQLLLALPEDVRLAIAELIAGRSFESAAADRKPSRRLAWDEQQMPLPMIEQPDPPSEPREAEPEMPSEALEEAKDSLREVAKKFPSSVIKRDLELALASDDIEVMREEIDKIVAVALREASNPPKVSRK